jgi:hypothetical protein
VVVARVYGRAHVPRPGHIEPIRAWPLGTRVSETLKPRCFCPIRRYYGGWMTALKAALRFHFEGGSARVAGAATGGFVPGV